MRKIIMAAIFFGVSVAAYSATIRVPQDKATVQAGIDAAVDGDEVVLREGKYATNGYLSIINKKITLRSNYDGNDWNIVKNTILTSNGPYVLAIMQPSGVVVRGITFTHDSLSSSSGFRFMAQGISGGGSNATIDSCIITNCVNISGYGGPNERARGAAIAGVNGVIQNNIIYNNYADSETALSFCGGIIKNNVIYNNRGSEVIITSKRTTFINNTVYNPTAYGAQLFIDVSTSSVVANNIMWSDGVDTYEYSGPEPKYCLIKGYKGPGKNNIAGDPKFVDPAHGDLRLQASSPCIDAGMTTASVKADLIGVQRGLKGVSAIRGDGSCVDIGAYEYKPKPVSVWLPNGGPDLINAGDNLTVAWEMETATAGTSILLQLYNGAAKVAELGSFTNGSGAARSAVKLPVAIPARKTYSIRGTSTKNNSLYSSTPAMTINSHYTAAPGKLWAIYR